MIKMWIEDKLDRIKWAWQRAIRGYDDRAVWNINSWFLDIMPKLLKDMNSDRMGYPSGLTSRKWSNVIDTMIECFTEANEDTCTKENKYQEEYDKMWEDFTKEFGLLGDNLSQPEDIEEGYVRVYMPSDKEVGRKDWQQLTKKYLKENEKLSLYRDKKLHEGLSLFDVYFWNLWD